MNRDPKEEEGGANLNVLCRNDPVNGFDSVGLESASDAAVARAVAIFMGKLTAVIFGSENAILLVTCGLIDVGSSVEVNTPTTLTESILATGIFTPRTVVIRWKVTKTMSGCTDCDYDLIWYVHGGSAPSA